MIRCKCQEERQTQTQKERKEKMTREERLEKIENALFLLDMKDRWTKEDLVRKYELTREKMRILRGEA